MDSLDSTNEPHPRCPVQGHILIIGEDDLSKMRKNAEPNWHVLTFLHPSLICRVA